MSQFWTCLNLLAAVVDDNAESASLCPYFRVAMCHDGIKAVIVKPLPQGVQHVHESSHSVIDTATERLSRCDI